MTATTWGEKALRYMLYAMFSRLHTLVENIHLYKLRVHELIEWWVVAKCQLDTVMLPPVFCKFLSSVMEVIGVTRSRAPTKQVVKVHENGKFITGEVESPLVFIIFVTRFVTVK